MRLSGALPVTVEGKRRDPPVRRIPPLLALYAFEAVSRHLSLPRASTELGRTESAVAKHLRSLEGSLGVRLLERSGADLRLTEAGDSLRLACERSFAELHSAIESVARIPGRQTLRVAVARSYGSRVLSRSIGQFAARYPWIEIVIDGYRHLADIGRGEADAAIRIGDGRWSDVRADKLGDDPLLPVCATAVCAEHPRSVAALVTTLPLLELTERNHWRCWLHATRVSLDREPHRIWFTETCAMLEAAEAGQGIALGRRSLVAEALRCGKLIRLPDESVDDGAAYYFCATAESLCRTPVRLFRDWLITKARGADSACHA